MILIGLVWTEYWVYFQKNIVNLIHDTYWRVPMKYRYISNTNMVPKIENQCPEMHHLGKAFHGKLSPNDCILSCSLSHQSGNILLLHRTELLETQKQIYSQECTLSIMLPGLYNARRQFSPKLGYLGHHHCNGFARVYGKKRIIKLQKCF